MTDGRGEAPTDRHRRRVPLRSRRIFLDEFAYDTHHQLTLRGNFNAVLGSRPLDEEIEYEMTFSGVLAFTVVELESSRVYEFEETFSFAEVIGSGWLPQLAAGDKFTPEHRHYLVQTYDDLVEIVAIGVAVQITGRRAMSRDWIRAPAREPSASSQRRL